MLKIEKIRKLLKKESKRGWDVPKKTEFVDRGKD